MRFFRPGCIPQLYSPVMKTNPSASRIWPASFSSAAGASPFGAARLRAHGRPAPRVRTRESLLGWLSSQCVEAFRAGLPADAFDSFRDEVLASVDRLRHADASFDQTFVRLDALAYRPA